MKWYNRISLPHYIFIGILLIAIQVIVLLYQGHIFFCQCGFIKFWHGALNTSQDSQHIADWYTFSHIIHGLVFYWFFQLINRLFFQKRLPVGLLLALSLGVEIGWEILENSPLIINRYREYTAALNYFGDSILNSVCDVLAMVLGFLIARKSPVWLSLVLIIGLELFTMYAIRDGLALNVIMLLYPLDAIKNWQMGL